VECQHLTNRFVVVQHAYFGRPHPLHDPDRERVGCRAGAADVDAAERNREKSGKDAPEESDLNP
jgi:hypothetical protein